MIKTPEKKFNPGNQILSKTQELEPIIELNQEFPKFELKDQNKAASTNKPNVQFSKFNDSFQKKKNGENIKNSFEILNDENYPDLSTSFSFGDFFANFN